MVRGLKILLYEKELKELEVLAWAGVSVAGGGDSPQTLLRQAGLAL